MQVGKGMDMDFVAAKLKFLEDWLIQRSVGKQMR